jgi:hypothetical protein
MTPVRRFPLSAAWLFAACLTVAGWSMPVSAMSMSAAPEQDHLSPRLAELAKPSTRSATHTEQARELGVAPKGPGSLLRDGNRVLVYVRFDEGAAGATNSLRAAGAQIVDVSRGYQTTTVAAKPADLHRLGSVPRVTSVTEARAPVTAAPCTNRAGSVVSEGVAQLNAGEGPGEARDEFSVDGSGVTVGILSDSFDQATEAADGSGPIAAHAADDVESADLPGLLNPCSDLAPVAVLEKDKSGEEDADEGRAMTQIVHDLAPGSPLAFASAFNGEPAFAKNIKALATAGARVIADDVFYFEEPFFQDGPVAVAASEAVAGGATYLSAAGNDNLIDAEGHDIGSWEAPEYRDAGSCPPKVESLQGANTKHCLDFNPGAAADRTFGIKVEPGAVLTVDLQWDEPWFGVSTDLDAFLLDASGNLIEVGGTSNLSTETPVEILQWANESNSPRTVQLVVNRFAGGDPRLKFALLENGSGVAATEYPRSTGEDVVGPTVFGHSGAADVISVGAMPFDDSSAVEEYSSRGPVRHDFSPVKGTTPAPPLPAAEEISKPDIAATDCGLTTFFAFLSGAGWRFCGTSAAAPHAAGVAALMLDAEPLATPTQVRSGLAEGAMPVGEFGPCAVGAGLIDALASIEDLLTPTGSTPAECLPPEPEGSVEEARAPGNWGAEAPPPPGGSVVVTPSQSPEEPPAEPGPGSRTLRTFIRNHPKTRLRTHSSTAKVVLRFGSNEEGTTFVCRIDGSLFHACPATLVRRFGIGRHSVRAVARDAAGNADPTPAIFRFIVVRVD